jgi:predicted transcriptional regulator
MDILKEKETLKKMPERSSQERNMCQINLIAQVLEGVKDADEGRLITTEELLARVDKWAFGPRF